MSFLGWSKGKVLHQLKELEEPFEFKTVKDPLDNRRSVQRLYGTETAGDDRLLRQVPEGC